MRRGGGKIHRFNVPSCGPDSKGFTDAMPRTLQGSYRWNGGSVGGCAEQELEGVEGSLPVSAGSALQNVSLNYQPSVAHHVCVEDGSLSMSAEC